MEIFGSPIEKKDVIITTRITASCIVGFILGGPVGAGISLSINVVELCVINSLT